MTFSSIRQTVDSLPYRHWSLYLFLASVWTLAHPYWANQEVRYHSPEIQTFVEVDHTLQPTAQPISIDGRTAAFIDRCFWLYIAVAYIVIEFCTIVARSWIASRRRHVTSNPAH